MKKIPLTRGKFALVDDEDYESINQWKWQVLCRDGTLYAYRNNYIERGSKPIYMHRQILSTPDGLYTDHKDGCGLNNQRHNIRICTPRQNSANRRMNANNKSGYKGVSWDTGMAKWRADIQLNQKKTYLGGFFCLIRAAEAYDKAALELFGEYARLNFPENNVQLKGIL